MAGRNINDDTKTEYLNWLLTPPTERIPRSKVDMAEELGVALKTLYNWENSEFFQTELQKIKAKWGTRWYGDVLGRLKDVIDQGTDRDAIAAARVLLGHMHVESEEKAIDVDDELVNIIRQNLQEQGYAVKQASAS